MYHSLPYGPLFHGFGVLEGVVEGVVPCKKSLQELAVQVRVPNPNPNPFEYPTYLSTYSILDHLKITLK